MQQQLMFERLTSTLLSTLAQQQQGRVSLPPPPPSGPQFAPSAPEAASSPSGAAPAPPLLAAPLSSPPPPFFPQPAGQADGAAPQLRAEAPPPLQASQPPAIPQADPQAPQEAQSAPPGPQSASSASAPQVIQQVSLHSSHIPSLAISAGADSASAFSPALGSPAISSDDSEAMLDNLFSLAKMPKGLRPIIHAESEHAPRTPEALEAMLHAWVDSTLDPLRGSLRFESASDALRKYVTATLRFAAQAGVNHAVDYHRAAMAAACHSPPLYDPISMGAVAEIQHMRHIQPYIGKASAGRGRFSGKRSQQQPSGSSESNTPQAGQSPGGSQRTPKRPRGSSQAGGADHCSLHPNGSHTNAQCYQQLGNQPGSRQSGATPTAAAPTAPRSNQ